MNLWQDPNFRKYFLYLYTKSTAVITPVLYILLSQKLHLDTSQILSIAAIYGFLSIVIEIPTGIISDLVGPRRTSLLAMLLLALSFASLLVFRGSGGFHVFMLLSIFSASFFSGTDQSLLRSLLSQDLYDEYRNWSFRSNGMMYLYTSPLLILGVYLYEKNPTWLILTQITLIGLGFISIYRIPEKIKVAIAPSSLRARVQKLGEGILQVLSQWRFIGMTLVSGAFASIVLVNHKTIQEQLSSYSNVSPLYSLALAYVVGNIISWKSAVYFQKLTGKPIPSKIILLGLTLMGATALYLLTLPWLGSALLGFFLMCAFKSAHRPLISSEFVKMCPDAGTTATLFSAVAFTGSLINAGLHLAVSKSFITGSNGNRSLLLLFLGIAAVGLIFVYVNPRSILRKLGKTSLNEKFNSIHLVDNELRFVQQYPADFFPHVHRKFASNVFPYPAPRFLGSIKEEFSMEWEYLKGIGVEKLARNEAEKQIREFFGTWLPAAGPILNAPYIPPTQLHIKLYRDHYVGTIHADLNPGNLISQNGKLFAVDWDLLQQGYFWYDVLSLLAHPETPLDLITRIELVQAHLPELNQNEAKLLLSDFAAYKVQQLQPWASELKNTIQGFQSLNLVLAPEL